MNTFNPISLVFLGLVVFVFLPALSVVCFLVAKQTKRDLFAVLTRGLQSRSAAHSADIRLAAEELGYDYRVFVAPRLDALVTGLYPFKNSADLRGRNHVHLQLGNETFDLFECPCGHLNRSSDDYVVMVATIPSEEGVPVNPILNRREGEVIHVVGQHVIRVMPGLIESLHLETLMIDACEAIDQSLRRESKKAPALAQPTGEAKLP